MRLLAALFTLFCGAGLFAQESSAWRSAASSLRPGHRVRIQKTDSTMRKGKVLSVQPDSLSVRWSKGDEETIPVTSLRRVWTRPPAVRNYAPLIGAGAGAAIAAPIATRPRLDLSVQGKVIYTAIGAGIGVGVGYLVRFGWRDTLVYESSPPIVVPSPR